MKVQKGKSLKYFQFLIWFVIFVIFANIKSCSQDTPDASDMEVQDESNCGPKGYLKDEAGIRLFEDFQQKRCCSCFTQANKL